MDTLTLLGTTLVLSLLINLSMFFVAFARKSDKLTDISYATTFALVALYGFVTNESSSFNALLLAIVLVWALRIGAFLLYRIVTVGKDARFDKIRNNFFAFGRFWLFQAITVWVVTIPVVLGFRTELRITTPVLLAACVAFVGIGVEAVADLQKLRFNSNKKNKGTWIEAGLWKYSRHPNYFGEILVWVGVYLYVLPGLSPQQALAAVASPITITMLLLFVSGIPILEKSADKKWGSLPGYRDYKSRTSVLIPLPNKKI